MSKSIGKYINDDHKKPNCKVVLKGEDLSVFTIRDIVQGEELRYDYGDKDSYWRKVKAVYFDFSFRFKQFITVKNLHSCAGLLSLIT